MTSRARELTRLRQELRTRFASARSGGQRLSILLDHAQARAVVRAMPAQDLFLLVKEVGLADAAPLVELASPAQFCTFIDLDAWPDGRFAPRRVLAWFRAAHGGGDETRAKLRAVDLETIGLVLRSTVRIHDSVEAADMEPKGLTWRTPEGKYVVELAGEGDEAEAVLGCIEDLYEDDPVAAGRMLEACRWELSSELEETEYRFRTGRLADLGFPDLAEALSFVAWRDPDAPFADEHEGLGGPPGFFLAPLASGAGFLDRAVAALPEEARERFLAALPLVANAVLVVDSTDPSDLKEVRRSVEAARDTLALGLEHASGGDFARAAEILASAPLKQLFQVGVSLALALKFRAERLLRSGLASFPSRRMEPLLDSPLREAVSALRHRRPLFARRLEGSDAGAPRTFRSQADLSRVSDALQAGEKLAAAMKALGFDGAEAENAVRQAMGDELVGTVRFSDLVVTMVARGAVGLGHSFGVLPGHLLHEALGRLNGPVGDQVCVAPEFERDLRATLARGANAGDATAMKVVEAFAALCLDRLRENVVGPIATDPKAKLGLPLIVGA